MAMWRSKLGKAKVKIEALEAARPLFENNEEMTVYQRRFRKMNRRRRRAIKKLKALRTEMSGCKRLFAL